jgi:hypothetical protein
VDNAQISGAQVANGTFAKRLAIGATIGDLWNFFPFVLVVLVCFSLRYSSCVLDFEFLSYCSSGFYFEFPYISLLFLSTSLPFSTEVCVLG